MAVCSVLLLTLLYFVIFWTYSETSTYTSLFLNWWVRCCLWALFFTFSFQSNTPNPFRALYHVLLKWILFGVYLSESPWYLSTRAVFLHLEYAERSVRKMRRKLNNNLYEASNNYLVSYQCCTASNYLFWKIILSIVFLYTVIIPLLKSLYW